LIPRRSSAKLMRPEEEHAPIHRPGDSHWPAVLDPVSRARGRRRAAGADPL